MGKVFARVQQKIDAAKAYDADNFIVLSHEMSPWSAEHLFSVPAPLPDEESVKLTGDFVTKVFEGPYANAKDWHTQMTDLARQKGGTAEKIYFFYTTCPKCAKAYGKNYVVGVARVV